MKEYVIILLLSLTGVEEIKLNSKGLNCGELAMAWVNVNMKYYPMMNGNLKHQGWYDSNGKLLLGWICP